MPLFEEEPILSFRGAEAWNEWKGRNPDFGDAAERWWTPDGQRPPRSKDVIDLSVAENTLMIPELKAHLRAKLSETLEDNDFRYGEGPGGSTRLRTRLTDFLNTHFSIPASQVLEKENIVTTPGVYAAMEIISWVVANPGDGILVGRPFYGGFIQGFARSRSRVKIVGVEFKGIDPFSKEAVRAYREAMERSDEDGTPIKAIFLCNPNNPLGRCFPKEVLAEYISLCSEKNIHLISDEIYALSHYRNDYAQKEVPFTSLLAMPADPKARNRIHVLYGMSKDFSASGVRAGAIISRSSPLLNSILTGVSYIDWVSSGGDLIWSCLLSDPSFTKSFIEKNQAKLGAHYRVVTDALRSCGIGFETECNAGVFVWIDLSYALEQSTELMDSKREAAVTERLIEAGVKLAPGRKFRTEEVGWYRLTFARPASDLTTAVERIVAALGTPDVFEQQKMRTG